MLKNKHFFILLIISVLIWTSYISVYAENSDLNVERLYGADRYSTNLRISNYGWQSNSEYAVIVSGQNFPDALCAAPLSSKYNAPTLMCNGNTLDDGLKYELARLNVKNVFIVGGPGVVSNDIENQLISRNINVKRLAGINRYETSVKVAEYIGNKEIFVVSGENFADALSISSYAANKCMPIILSLKDTVPDSVKNYINTIKPSKVSVIGGSGVISDNTASKFGSYKRFWGITRYETNYNILTNFYSPSDLQKIYMISGENYPDGLSVSPLAAKTNSPVVLINDSMSYNQIKFIRDNKDKIIGRIAIGGDAVAPKYVIDRFFANCTSISPEDFIKTYSIELPQGAVNAFKNLSLGNYLYPNDTNLTNTYNTAANKLLETAKNTHQNRNYDEAINMYDCLLQNNVSQSIKNQAIVYKNVALTKNKIASKYVYKDSYKPYVKQGLDYYKNIHLNLNNPISYTALGDYLRFSKTESYGVSDEFKLDNNGIPLVKFGSQFYYNTVTICQYALWLHSKYLNGDTSTLDSFIKCADFLCNFMKSDGSFRYDINYYSYEQLKSGWTSSMAQGQALSVLSRAYNLTQDTKYINAGIKAFNHLTTSVKNGGVMDTLESLDPAFKNNIFFQEYVNTVSSYTLNGYMFTLLGIYDWLELSKTVSSIDNYKATYYYTEGVKSLKIVLPYYDYGGFSSYDLYYLTAGTNPTPSGHYHKIHLDLLEAFYSMTKDQFFMDIRNQWASYIS